MGELVELCRLVEGFGAESPDAKEMEAAFDLYPTGRIELVVGSRTPRQPSVLYEGFR